MSGDRKDNDDGGLDDNEVLTLTLKSQDMQSFPVGKDVAIQSALIKTMWSGDQSETEIPLPNVRGVILKRVIKYMEYHHTNPAKEIEKPLKSANMREVVSEWDANYVEVDQETLFELILAANYMDIKPLLDLTCAKVASMIKGKTPEEIRKRFNIQNDFSPEEEEAVRAENKWAEDS
jgi:S-phase kinase-associated protein 1